MKREAGYYWVRDYGEWTIAEWMSLGKHDPKHTKLWALPGLEYYFTDSDFEEIDENRITR